MSATITLGDIVDAATSRPATRTEIYQQTKCPVTACRSCSAMFNRSWRLARRLGLIQKVGTKFALRSWDERAAEALGVWP